MGEDHNGLMFISLGQIESLMRLSFLIFLQVSGFYTFFFGRTTRHAGS